MRDGLSRKEWLERRRQYIGGSDAAAALGISRFKTMLQLCMDKWNESEDKVTEVMERGTILEPLVAHLYKEATGHETKPGPWCVSDDHPHMAATPDLEDVELECIVQLKTVTSWVRYQWTEAKKDQPPEIPDDYMVQGQHEMAVTGATENVFGVLFADDASFRALVWLAKGGMPVEKLGELVSAMIDAKDSKVEFQTYPIQRDQPLIDTIIAGEADFWSRFVVPHEMPPDASIPEKSPKIITADMKESAILEKYFQARADEKEAKEIADQWRTQIETMIGDKAGIAAEGIGKILYKAPTPKAKTDHEAVSKGMRSSDPEKYDVLEAKHTTTTQAKRKFTPYPVK